MINQPRKILFIHQGALGDFLLVLPVIAAYRKNGDETGIHVCAGAAVRRLARAWGLFSGEVDPERDDFFRLFLPGASVSRSLTGILSGFDLLITTSTNQEFRANLQSLGPMVLAPAEEGLSSPRHIQDIYRECLLLPSMREGERGIEPSIPPPEAWISRGREILGKTEEDRALVIHPGSGGKIKCWPASRFLEIAERASQSGWNPMFLVGPVEQEMPGMGGILNSHRFPVLSDLDLTDAAAVLAAAKLYLGNDSGITHLAAVLGTPVLAIFGPSDPGRFGPRGRSVKIIYSNYECSPCHPTGREGSSSECGKNQACLKEIGIEMVEKEIEKLA